MSVTTLTDIITDDRDARIIWSLIAEPMDSAANRFIDEFDTAKQAIEFVINREPMFEPADDATQDYTNGLERWLPRLSSAEFLRVKAAVKDLNITVLIPGDEHWPMGISILEDKQPLALYVRGDAALLNTPMIGLVGARAASGYGEHVTMELATGVVDRGYTVVSGAAYGIDGMAHRAAIASRGKTVAVLAGGVDRFYPAGHDQLLSRIVEVGAVVSELPPGSSPTKWRFLARNRIIAALSDALVVVEAGFRSGSLNCAGHAEALNIPLGAVPGPVTSPTSAGCHRLLRETSAVCVTNAEDIASLATGIPVQAKSVLS